MDALGGEVTLWQQMLERPNFWVEGSVPLRTAEKLAMGNAWKKNPWKISKCLKKKNTNFLFSSRENEERKKKKRIQEKNLLMLNTYLYYFLLEKQNKTKTNYSITTTTLKPPMFFDDIPRCDAVRILYPCLTFSIFLCHL